MWLLISAFIFGVFLGVFHFGSLWITVRQLPTTAYPVRLFIGSFIGRMAVTLIGFSLVMHGEWQRLLVCLVGFVGVRILLTRHWGPKPEINLSVFTKE